MRYRTGDIIILKDSYYLYECFFRRESIKQYGGKVTKIVEVDNVGWGTRYVLEIDNKTYRWTDDCFTSYCKNKGEYDRIEPKVTMIEPSIHFNGEWGLNAGYITTGVLRSEMISSARIRRQ